MGGAGAAGPSDCGCHCASGAGDLPGECAILSDRAYSWGLPLPRAPHPGGVAEHGS